MRLVARWRTATRALDGGLRKAYLRSEVTAHPLSRVAESLNEICAAAERAEPVARELLITLVDVLGEPSSTAFAQALREEAAGQSLLSLGRLLRRASGRASTMPPSSPSSPPIGEARIPDYGTGRPLTLGERRALARRPSRAGFEKLFADPHPMVIRLLLDNPKVTEDDIIRLSSRRPARGDVLAEVIRHQRWSHRVRVRLALVLNPDAPSELTIPLLGLLTRPELRQVAASTELSPVVRATAREFFMRRPPLRPPRSAPVQ